MQKRLQASVICRRTRIAGKDETAGINYRVALAYDHVKLTFHEIPTLEIPPKDIQIVNIIDVSARTSIELAAISAALGPASAKSDAPPFLDLHCIDIKDRRIIRI